jgi:hypothetical protein
LATDASIESIFFFATSEVPFMFQVTITVRRLFET